MLKTYSQLNEAQLHRLNAVLAVHNMPEFDPEKIPANLAFACLGCGSIGVMAEWNPEARDFFVTHFDPTCDQFPGECLVTVWFHSDHQRILAHPVGN